jgi:hypothetical protein
MSPSSGVIFNVIFDHARRTGDTNGSGHGRLLPLDQIETAAAA